MILMCLTHVPVGYLFFGWLAKTSKMVIVLPQIAKIWDKWKLKQLFLLSCYTVTSKCATDIRKQWFFLGGQLEMEIVPDIAR